MLDCAEKPAASGGKHRHQMGTARKSTEPVHTLTNLGLLVEDIEAQTSNNLLEINDILGASHLEPKAPEAPKVPSKKRLKKSEISAYKDPEESPIKLKKRDPSPEFRKENYTPDLDLFMTNLTKTDSPIVEGPPLQKPSKPAKPNTKAKKPDPELKPRSPSKVSCRLRLPKSPRTYTLRKGESTAAAGGGQEN